LYIPEKGEGGNLFVVGCCGLQLEDVEILGGVAYRGGGASIRYSRVDFCHSAVSGNSALRRGGPGGGGIYSIDSHVYFLNVRVTENSAMNGGGGIFSIRSRFILGPNSGVDHNRSGENSHGGGIFLKSSGIEIDADAGVYNNTPDDVYKTRRTRTTRRKRRY
jgi:hypothetical protein